MKNKYLKKEIERQVKIAKEHTFPREEWQKDKEFFNKHWGKLIGAYHLGRLEALEDIHYRVEV